MALHRRWKRSDAEALPPRAAPSSTHVLVFVLTRQASQFGGNTHQHNTTTSNHALLLPRHGSRAGHRQRVLFYFHFNFGSAPTLITQRRLPVSLRAPAVFHGRNQVASSIAYGSEQHGLNSGLFTHAIDDGGGVFVDHNTFHSPSLPVAFSSSIPISFRDYGTTSQVAMSCSIALRRSPKRCFNRSHFHDATHSGNPRSLAL